MDKNIQKQEFTEKKISSFNNKNEEKKYLYAPTITKRKKPKNTIIFKDKDLLNGI